MGADVFYLENALSQTAPGQTLYTLSENQVTESLSKEGNCYTVSSLWLLELCSRSPGTSEEENERVKGSR